MTALTYLGVFFAVLIQSYAQTAPTVLQMTAPAFPQTIVDPGFRPAFAIDFRRKEVTAMTVQPDGKILVHLSGQDEKTGNSTGTLLRLNSDGSADATFSFLGVTNLAGLTSDPLVQPDGKILLGAVEATTEHRSGGGIVRLNADGSLDTTFNPLTGGEGIRTILLQADGKVVAGGIYVSIDGRGELIVARFETDGRPDVAFNTRSAEMQVEADALAQQLDGKLLVAARYIRCNTDASECRYSPSLFRLNRDGSRDMSFSPVVEGQFFGMSILALVLQADGKILLGGYLGCVNGILRPGVARLNPDGSLDESFNNTGAFTFNPTRLWLRSQGKPGVYLLANRSLVRAEHGWFCR
ncbi:MAG: hypothetical protein L0Z50_41660 [Verrucomicrobiales bacterium]|nr:hypothetical protein [Verrucomicrobiales bacterium]